MPLSTAPGARPLQEGNWDSHSAEENSRVRAVQVVKQKRKGEGELLRANWAVGFMQLEVIVGERE